MRTRVNVRVHTHKIDALKKLAKERSFQKVKEAGYDLKSAASGAAPHDEGILDTSGKVTPRKTGKGGDVTVTFKAIGHRGFNYALKMHEGFYNLGPKSQAKPGGVGMSGTLYRVGPKYLERPLRGEDDEYKKHIRDGVSNAVKKFK